MLAKKLRTALDQLAEEGVVQIFRPLDGSPPIVGVVGQLQLDVLQSRLKVEYGVPAGFDATRWQVLRWMSGERAEIERWAATSRSDTAEDHDGEYVALFGSDWRRKRAEEDFPKLKFHAVREQHGVVQMQR
jgi:peptide chain release factor 3